MERVRKSAAQGIIAGSAAEGPFGRLGRDLFLPLVLGAFVAFVFSYQVARYYFVCDDAFISLRYAQNLLEGHGLVYNPGERVEGYTNFLWTLMMAGWMKLGCDPEVSANAIGIASGVAILAMVAGLGAAQGGWRDPLIWIAPAALAVNRTFAAWCTSGLETQFFVMLVLGALLCFLRERSRQARWPVGSALLLAVATLTRPEGGLFFAVTAGFLAYDVLIHRRGRLAGLACWTVLYAVMVGGHLLWRHGYYGYWLPNTFYVKVSGFWWAQSKVWFWLFLRDYYVMWFLPLLAVAVAVRIAYREILLAVALAAYVAYLVYVGGDQFEFRLLTPALPLLYFVLQERIRAAVSWLRTQQLAKPGGEVLGWTAGVLLILGSCAPNLTGFDGARFGIASLEQFKAYTAYRIGEGLFFRNLVEEGYLSGQEIISVGGAGALPFHSRLYTIDFRGLNDAEVAHQPISRRGWIFHEKAASPEYLKRRGVAIWDVENRIVQPMRAPTPTPHLAQRDFYQGPVRCVEAQGHYLVFATTLSEDEFQVVFRKFRIVF